MTDALIETWEIHSRINLYLLRAIAAPALAAISSAKGRSVAEQFAHIHNVRLMWLKAAAPALLDGIEKVEKVAAPTSKTLVDALTKSGTAIAELIQQSIGAGGKVKGFKPHVTAFVGYLIAHESHHRGQIMLTLKEAGHPVDKKIAFGIWEWGSR